MGVLDEGSLSHIHGQLANVSDVVADSFNVLGYEKLSSITSRGGGL